MKSKVRLRELKKTDLNALEDIIRKTWNYDKFAAPKTAKRLAALYLAACLTNQTYTSVAEMNGVPVGVILGKNIEKHHCPFKYRWHQLTALCQLLILKEGSEILSFYKNVSDIDSRLLKKCPKDYKGEVALFAVSPECRGLGVGKQLFRSLLAYMKKKNIEDIYLYTDTSCNFGFYEHQGMSRQQQHRQLVNMRGQTAEIEFYLYDMVI